MARCNDSTYATEAACLAANKFWCPDSIDWTTQTDPLGALTTCLDTQGVVDAVVLWIGVAVTVAVLLTGWALTARIIRAAGQA